MTSHNIAEYSERQRPQALYSGADEGELFDTASRCLLEYGTKWHPRIVTGAKGSYIYTSTSHRVLDWTSGQMSCLIGHGNAEVAATIAEHAYSLDHTFSGMLSPPVMKLGEMLTSLLPEGLDKAMFLSTGGESNEAAIRLAKVATGKFEIVGMDASWHGKLSEKRWLKIGFTLTCRTQV